MYLIYILIVAFKAIDLQGFNLIIRLLGGKHLNKDVTLISGLLEQLLDHDSNTMADNYKDMRVVAEDPGKIVAKEYSLTLYVPSTECEMAFMDWKLLAMIGCVTILNIVRLVRDMRKKKIIPKTKKQKVCSDDEEEDVFFEFQLAEDEATGEANQILKPDEDVEPAEEDANLEWESGEENGFPDVPSDLEWYPGDLLFKEQESFIYLESLKKGFLELPFNEEEFFDWSSDYQENPALVSDEEELRRYFERKQELFPDSPSDDEEIFNANLQFQDLPSEDEERFCSYSHYFQDY